MSIWGKLTRSGLVAGGAFLAAAPYFYYFTTVAFTDHIRARVPGLSIREILRIDMTVMAIAVVISALVGTFFSKRYELGGFGDVRSLGEIWPLLAIVGPILCVATYFIFGTTMAERIPGYFPTSVVWAFALVLRGAVFDEIIARYGMMTIIAGVAPRPWIANVLQALFFTAMIFKGLGFFGLAASWDAFFISSLISAFCIHLLQGAVYSKKGIVASIALHFVIDLKFVLHALIN